LTSSTNTLAAVIVSYRPEYREAFERLNRAWLDAYSLLEPADLEYLEDPETYVLAVGGQVFFAVANGEVVGTCAVIPHSAGSYELAKLAVAPGARGRGLGRRLSEVAIEFARRAGASEVVLCSNTALSDAIRLYESLGFRHTPVPPDNPYRTANVFMTLTLR
jgi:GNAT superfamily N-acetyltransferase